MIDKDFFKKIVISEEEIPKASFYIKYRGLVEHDYVRKYLESYKHDMVTYSEIATTFRYDKRIRRILFKYIGFIEEYIRAILCELIDDIEKLKVNKKISNRIAKYDDIYTALNELLFSDLLSVIKINKINLKENLQKYSKMNISALVTLRNKVFHNVFILGYMNYEECEVDGIKSSSFRNNVLNLRQLLPVDKMRLNFDKEINEAKQPGDNKYENQVEWKLVNEIVLEI